MLENIIISDSSPLIALEDIGHLNILRQLYSTVYITDIVRNEVEATLPEWIKVVEDYDSDKFELLKMSLDDGEASAIAFAKDQKNCRLIIDEKRGRKIAKNLGIQVIGLLGIILRAKEKKLISSGKEILEALVVHGFWLSERLKQQLLEQLGEA